MYCLIQLTVIHGLPYTELKPVTIHDGKVLIHLSKSDKFPPQKIFDTLEIGKPYYQKGKFASMMIIKLDSNENRSSSILRNTRILIEDCLKNITSEEDKEMVEKVSEIYNRTKVTLDRIL